MKIGLGGRLGGLGLFSVPNPEDEAVTARKSSVLSASASVVFVQIYLKRIAVRLYLKTPDEKKVEIASLHLQRDAIPWMSDLYEPYHSLDSWS